MHDLHGNPLQVGDTVLVPAVVTEVFPDSDACNITVQAIHPEGDTYRPLMTGNSKSVVLASAYNEKVIGENRDAPPLVGGFDVAGFDVAAEGGDRSALAVFNFDPVTGARLVALDKITAGPIAGQESPNLAPGVNGTPI